MIKLNREYLDNAMAKKLFNAADLARTAQISNATLSRMLKNNAVYSLKALGKIALALDIKEPKDLLQMKGEYKDEL
ncbi:helix-turn-helix transcriptional regulator [Megamonas hypermegale]|uniref:helix-turn-helix domain-containing protein n=1 Tax=Megamonas hypermegale TaxID=158847 RepID=UPI00320858C2